MTHYEVLGVARDASPDEIKRAYRKLAKQHHPDREGGDHERMQQVQIAYDVLSDPEKRKRYDETGTADQPKPMEHAAAEVIAQMFSQLVLNGQDQHNPLPQIWQLIADNINGIQQHIKMLEKIEKKRGRVKHRNPEAVNLFETTLDALERDSKVKIEQLKQSLQIINHARVMMADYEYVNPHQSGPTQGFIFYAASPTYP